MLYFHADTIKYFVVVVPEVLQLLVHLCQAHLQPGDRPAKDRLLKKVALVFSLSVKKIFMNFVHVQSL